MCYGFGVLYGDVFLYGLTEVLCGDGGGGFRDVVAIDVGCGCVVV